LRSKADEALRAAEHELKGLPFTMVLPAASSARESLQRMPRRINALRTIEAVRLFAAKHGRLPKSLDEIKDVPVPVDLFTGKPFSYRLEGETAIVDLPQLPSQSIQDARRYEITLRK
jgi:hypothetical protein